MLQRSDWRSYQGAKPTVVGVGVISMNYLGSSFQGVTNGFLFALVYAKLVYVFFGVLDIHMPSITQLYSIKLTKCLYFVIVS